ncbi:MAG: hypothetical protein EOM64_01530 [Erysipelotrichia bacterium]|nr:hypothetical protein [Erysipelotrichia bacterium]
MEVAVAPESETAWLNRSQIAELFDRDIRTVGKHINAALKEELFGEAAAAKFLAATKHGAVKEKAQTHETEYFTWDGVLSAEYRVKPKNDIIFRNE